MKIKLQTTLGNNLFDVECEVASEKDFFKKFGFFSDMPTECDHCKNKNLAPEYRNAKGFDYYSIRCKSCGYQLQFGQYKDGSGLFAKGWSAPVKKDSAPHTPASADIPDWDG